jgi:hypothetical protein
MKGFLTCSTQRSRHMAGRQFLFFGLGRLTVLRLWCIDIPVVELKFGVRVSIRGFLRIVADSTMFISPLFCFAFDIRHSSGMAEFNTSTIDRKQPHLYLAQMPGTRKAILPVHTSAEHDLFRRLMKSNPVFNTQSSGPIWKLAVKVWNEFADKQSGIFYKVHFPESVMCSCN